MNQPRKILFKVEKVEPESILATLQGNTEASISHIVIPSNKKFITKQVKQKAQPKYLCSLCNKNCHSKVNYDRHQRQHNKHEFQCPICKAICLNKLDLANHMRGNHMIPCESCLKIFSTQKEYTQHASTHFVSTFLIEFIAVMCQPSSLCNKLARRIMLSPKDRKELKKKMMLLKRSRLLHKYQQVKEFNRNDDSTDNDE